MATVASSISTIGSNSSSKDNSQIGGDAAPGCYTATTSVDQSESSASKDPRCETFCFPDGSQYTGEFKFNRHQCLVRHGQGTMSFKNGNKYIGEWKDDLMHGQGQITAHPATKRTSAILRVTVHNRYNKYDFIRTHGQFLAGKYQGQGTISFPGAAILEGSLSES
eukprot:gene4272-8498_t